MKSDNVICSGWSRVMKFMRGFTLVTAAVMFAEPAVHAGEGQWAYMDGSPSPLSVQGVYGAEGEFDAAYNPGARNGSVSWTDAAGNLWLFGGSAFRDSRFDDHLNDLWKYDISKGQWAYMKGTPGLRNQIGVYSAEGEFGVTIKPGARAYAVSWTDAAGDLWLHGGFGYGASLPHGLLNDLWKYHVELGQWAYMGGTPGLNSQHGIYGAEGTFDKTFMPGGRSSAVSWTDAEGNFWLFGGSGFGASSNGDLNDLWQYDVKLKQWAYMGGTAGRIDRRGIYGGEGMFDETFMPGGRAGAVTWTDAAGDLWLFGGFGRGTTASPVRLNDLWKFDVDLGHWGYMKGTPGFANQTGVYGAEGAFDEAFIPGGRIDPVSWTDEGGDLWLFGGHGYGISTSIINLNDLWKYDVSNGHWAYMKGTPGTLGGNQGVYGPAGIFDESYKPGARSRSLSWTDTAGDFWLFGGSGYNDLWIYDTPKTRFSAADDWIMFY